MIIGKAISIALDLRLVNQRSDPLHWPIVETSAFSQVYGAEVKGLTARVVRGWLGHQEERMTYASP